MIEETLKKLNKTIDGLKNKSGKVLFFVPNITTPSSSVYEIYFHANVLRAN